MRRVGFWIWLAGWIVALSACGGATDGGGAAQGSQATRQALMSVASFTPVDSMASAAASQNQRRTQRGPAPQSLSLAAPALEQRRSLESDHAGVAGKPRRIGLAREVTPTQSHAATASFLKWENSARGGKVAAVSFSSREALAVRLGLVVRKMPLDAVVRVYAQKGSTVTELLGSEILTSIHRNVDKDGDSEAARTFWTPLVEGEEATLEIELAPGSPVESLVVAMPRLSHVFVMPTMSKTAESQRLGEAASCQVDVACASDVDTESSATARMVYVAASGDSYLCTGTLLADAARSRTPYFLSAYHCISRQSEASSLVTYWFYRASSCGSGVLSASAASLSSGATLLYTSRNTDTSFMRLSAAPPAGAGFAGWDANTPAGLETIIGLHHPRGDMQKINRGTLAGFKTCTEADAEGNYSCMESSASGANHLSSRWGSGVTEGGSSGSGLFKTVDGAKYLVGQLHGGSSSCTSPSSTDSYGRFDLAYGDGLKNWLDLPARNPVYRFFNASTGAHFFTINAAERDFVKVAYPVFRYESEAFYAYAQNASGLSPIYRFFNTRTGAHFYTINEAEKNFVIATYKEFNYEGPSWYAQAGGGNGTTPLYRFFNTVTGAHFYTVSAAEKDYVIYAYPAFRFEGIAYYVWTTQR